MQNESISAIQTGKPLRNLKDQPGVGSGEEAKTKVLPIADTMQNYSVKKRSCTVGTVLAGRYEILKTLGEGGMGHVFQAHDRLTSKLCAIKIMSANLTGSETDLLRFKREADVSIELKHRNIVDVFDKGCTEDHKPFIVMEYLQGKCLADILLEKERLNINEFAKIFKQICEGLSYSHANQVVHRDIKPSNIMVVNVDGKQIAKIVDFGIARRCKTTGEVCPTTLKSILDSCKSETATALAANDERLQRLTQPGEVFGSPLYMSPEQCRGEEADCRSEVYAMGCMMFEALTGIPPLKGGSALQTMLRRVNDEAPSLNSVVPGLTFPQALEDIVARSLKREPEERFHSVDELLAALIFAC
ncbi:MAG TPA: serine/threonine-protein kinase [Trichormus sp.]|jgi:serine/threonine-protein kinase